METIDCTKCGLPKDEKEFPLNGDGKGGRRKQCLTCMREINKAWRKMNKEKVKNYNQQRNVPKADIQSEVDPIIEDKSAGSKGG